MEKIRCFIAIELDDELKRALAEIQRDLKSEPASKFVRWIAPDGIHLTLKFLGEVEATRVTQLLEAMQRASRGIAAFELDARGLGCFPDLARPNVVWVGVEGVVESAQQIAHRVEEECARLGFARDARGFTPHLTLGRVKKEARPNERKQIGEMIRGMEANEIGRLNVSTLYLMKSDLQPSGAIYSVMGKVELVA